MLRVTTESGSVHEIDQEEGRVRRLPGVEAGGLDADGDWVKITALSLAEGHPMLHVYRPDEVRASLRTTTPVVSIEEI